MLSSMILSLMETRRRANLSNTGKLSGLVSIDMAVVPSGKQRFATGCPLRETSENPTEAVNREISYR